MYILCVTASKYKQIFSLRANYGGETYHPHNYRYRDSTYVSNTF